MVWVTSVESPRVGSDGDGWARWKPGQLRNWSEQGWLFWNWGWTHSGPYRIWKPLSEALCLCHVLCLSSLLWMVWLPLFPASLMDSELLRRATWMTWQLAPGFLWVGHFCWADCDQWCGGFLRRAVQFFKDCPIQVKKFKWVTDSWELCLLARVSRKKKG